MHPLGCVFSSWSTSPERNPLQDRTSKGIALPKRKPPKDLLGRLRGKKGQMLAPPIFLLAGGIAWQRYINIGSGRLRNWPLDWMLRFTIDVEVKCSLLKSLGHVTCTHPGSRMRLARTGRELGVSCCGWFCVCPVGPGATWDLVAVALFMFVPSGPGAKWELVAAVGSVFVPLGRVRSGI